MFRWISKIGSNTRYIIICIVLSFGLISVAFLLNQRSNQVYEENETIVSQDKTKTNEETKVNESNGSIKVDDSSSESELAQDDTVVGTNVSSSKIPETGPESVIGGSIAIFFLVFALMEYIKSRYKLFVK